MNRNVKPEFDQYAGKYTDLHRESVRASGEDPAYFSAYKAKYIAAAIGPEATDTPLDILDFGCGIGNSIPHLRRAFPTARIHGTDPSGESIRIAEESHSRDAAFKSITDLTLPYADHSFDIILVACVFHHIQPDKRAHWIDQIKRALKPGGKAFIFEHNILNPLTVKAVKDCPFDEDAILLPKSELINLANGAKFTTVHAHYIVFFPHALAFMRPLEPFMKWIPFGAQYVVHAYV